MKIIQVTDVHLGPRDLSRFGINQHDRLNACIAQINAKHADAALCVITGDLADRGEVRAYEDLRTALQALTVPHVLLLGNHDRRAPFLEVFPDASLSPGGFVQSMRDVGDVRLVFLDTVVEGHIEGALDAARLDWLDAQLAGAAGRTTLVFMHHPPVTIGIPMLDPLALQEPEAFLAVLKRHDAGVHLFFGHVHRSVHGTVDGVPFAAQRGLSMQFALDLDGVSSAAHAAPPSYGVILVGEGNVVLHEEPFLTGWPSFDLETGEKL